MNDVSKVTKAKASAPQEAKPISEPGKGPIKVFLAGQNAGKDSRSTAAGTRD